MVKNRQAKIEEQKFLWASILLKIYTLKFTITLKVNKETVTNANVSVRK